MKGSFFIKQDRGDTIDWDKLDIETYTCIHTHVHVIKILRFGSDRDKQNYLVLLYPAFQNINSYLPLEKPNKLQMKVPLNR